MPYEVSDWVEERLVEVLRNGVEGIVQEVRPGFFFACTQWAWLTLGLVCRNEDELEGPRDTRRAE